MTDTPATMPDNLSKLRAVNDLIVVGSPTTIAAFIRNNRNNRDRTYGIKLVIACYPCVAREDTGDYRPFERWFDSERVDETMRLANSACYEFSLGVAHLGGSTRGDLFRGEFWRHVMGVVGRWHAYGTAFAWFNPDELWFDGEFYGSMRSDGYEQGKSYRYPSGRDEETAFRKAYGVCASFLEGMQTYSIQGSARHVLSDCLAYHSLSHTYVYVYRSQEARLMHDSTEYLCGTNYMGCVNDNMPTGTLDSLVVCHGYSPQDKYDGPGDHNRFPHADYGTDAELPEKGEENDE